MASLSHYLTEVQAAIDRRDGNHLCCLLREAKDDTVNAMCEYYETNASITLPSKDPAWEQLPVVIDKCFSIALAIRHDDWVDAYDHVVSALAAFIEIMSTQDAWALPVLLKLCEDLRLIARVADQQMKQNNRKATLLEAAEPILKRAFTVVNNDRRPVSEDSRRVGVLGMMNQLLRVYFTINNLGLCNNVIRTTTQASFPSFEEFPLPHRVTFKFFEGRYRLYEDKYAEAVTSFLYALARVPPHLRQHRRRILAFLIPAQILTGRLPSRHTLDHFNIVWYKDIVEAIRTGNVGQFEAAVTRYEDFFIKSALYLAVEKMKSLVYRALVRRVTMTIDQNKIALEDVLKAMRLCGLESSRDDAECMLSNLIFKGFIRGYISHKIGYLVLSKKTAFPPVPELCEAKLVAL